MQHSKSWGRALALALGAALAGSAAAAAPKATPHPLCPDPAADACAIYDTGRAAGATALAKIAGPDDIAQAIPALAASGIVILGEAHDNPHHHKLRAKLLKRGTKAVVMEHLRADQQAGVDAFNTVATQERRPATLEDFKAKVDWANGGWDKYPIDPLLGAVVEAQVPVYAGDPPRDLIRRIAKEGPAALPEADRARLALDRPLGDNLDAASGEEIVAAHCGMLPAKAVPNMAFAQRYRDAHIADATLRAADENGSAVLLTGNVHARLDRGVPFYIRARAPDRTVVSVVLVEVEDGEADPEAYVPRDPDGKPAADFLVFTPKAERGDPCAAFGVKK